LTEENVNSTTKVFNLPLEYPKYKYFFIYFTPAPYENPETGFLVFDTVVFYKEKIRIEKPDLSPVESVLRKSGKSLREKNESSGVADWDFEIVSEGNDWFMNLNAYSDWNVIGKPVDRILIYKPYKDVRKEQEVFLTDIEMGNYWVHHIPRRFLDGNPEIGYVSETGSVEFNSDDIFKYSFEDFICFNNKGDLISKDLLEIDVPEKKIEYTGIDIPTELWFYHFKPGYLSEGEVTFTEKETVISYEDSLFKKTVLYFRQNGETTKFIPYSSATQQVTSESNLRYGYRSGFGYYIEVSDDLIDVPLRTIEFNFPQIYVNQLIKVNESQPEL
jgi:hypothetical protein